MRPVTRTYFGGILVPIVLILLQTKSCFGASIRDEMLLTDDQKAAFERFKVAAINVTTTAPYMQNELVLIKYFRFCDMDEKKAMDRLKDNLKWRLELGFEQLTEDEISEFARNFPFTLFPDKAGRTFVFIAGKYWDLAKATGTPEGIKKFAKFAYHMNEEAYIKGVSNTTGRTAAGIVYFIDVKDADGARAVCMLCIAELKKILLELELRYPGAIQLGIIVNANPLAKPALNVLKNALSEKLRQFAFVYDEDDTVWLPELVKIIGAEKVGQLELYIRSQHAPGAAAAPAPAAAAAAAAGGGGAPAAMFGMGMAQSMMFGAPQVAPAETSNPEGRGVKKAKKGKKGNKASKGGDDDDDAGID